MIAVGEVGLPYYKLKDNPSLSIEGYVDVLQNLYPFSKQMVKNLLFCMPIYEDAPQVCDMLEKHSY